MLEGDNEGVLIGFMSLLLRRCPTNCERMAYTSHLVMVGIDEEVSQRYEHDLGGYEQPNERVQRLCPVL